MRNESSPVVAETAHNAAAERLAVSRTTEPGQRTTGRAWTGTWQVAGRQRHVGGLGHGRACTIEQG